MLHVVHLVSLVNFTSRKQFRNVLYICPLALSLDGQTGNFEVGKDFDALRVNMVVPGGPIDLIQPEGPKVGVTDVNIGATLITMNTGGIIPVFIAGSFGKVPEFG